MIAKTFKKRQKEYQDLISEAFQNEEIREAWEIFQIDQIEYSRAIAATTMVNIVSGNSSNPGENNASLDRYKE